MKSILQAQFLIRGFYALCLAGATCNHAALLVAHGLGMDYGGMPAFVSAFWAALTFADPLAAILLFPAAGRPGRLHPASAGLVHRHRHARGGRRGVKEALSHYNFAGDIGKTRIPALVGLLLTLPLAWKVQRGLFT